ncbi:MAG: ABC transporter substrate-binding protein, partial [Oscillospiraceae bacterium]|nr:ABC transporter substrate-binding protein [Oscillospiraceae bacterium]
ELKNKEVLAGLKAVQNGTIYCVPTVGHAWGNRTVEQPLTILWTINKCYPELLSDEELGKYIYDFYDHFFSYQLTDEQLATYVSGN